MIISASRRTDIPAFYSEWFFNRIEAGYVCVRNPVNSHRVSRIDLSPEVVDGIVFWTKNPIPMLSGLNAIRPYQYYFQFTLNSYGRDVEKNLPSKNDSIIPAFKELSRRIGPERVIWRYDPIMFTPKYTMDYHVTYFNEIAKRLSGYTEKCIISFLDFYRNTQNNTKNLGILKMEEGQMRELAQRFMAVASQYHFVIESCAEEIDLEPFGIRHGHCVDCALFESLIGYQLDIDKDKNQREHCGCVASIDIGAYNTCRNGCRYCYANHSLKAVESRTQAHDPLSPVLYGHIGPEDVVTDRKVHSSGNLQIKLRDLGECGKA
ncbi:MAG: DUF1848 domain-containing protein [Oscillospiraceae bacterium]